MKARTVDHGVASGSALLDQLDPAVPGLGQLLDAEAVGRRFEDRWPVDGGPPMRVVDARRLRLAYEPGRRGLAVYRLEVVDGASAPQATLGVVEITAAGSRHRLYQDDPALPGLAEAADGGRVMQELARLAPHPVATCQVTPVSYRPGIHCVFRYELRSAAPDGAVTVLFAKAHAAGAKAVASTLADLHRCGLADGGFEVSAPVAVLGELGLVVQARAEGQSLGERLFGPSATASGGAGRVAAAVAVGRALASLHRADGPPGPARTLAEELAELRAQAAMVAKLDPSIARRVLVVLDDLEGFGGDATTPVAAPGHGSFRADHVVLDGDRVQLLDLDGYGWAEPARDAGNLLAYLRWKAHREPSLAPAVADTRAGFLAGYGAEPGAGLDDERCAVFEATSALKIVVRRFRRLAVSEWDLVGDLVDAAADLLAGRQRVSVP